MVVHLEAWSELDVWEIPPVGPPVLAVHVANMVPDVGLLAIAAIMGGGFGGAVVGGNTITPSNYADLRLCSQKLGDVLTPPAPLAGDTAMFGPVVWWGSTGGTPAPDAVMSITYPVVASTGVIRCSTSIPQLDLVGMILTEEAIFTKLGTLVARTTFSKEKLNTFGLMFNHTIYIERA